MTIAYFADVKRTRASSDLGIWAGFESRLVALQRLEQGHDVFCRPAFISHGRPSVEVGPCSTHVVGAVDTARPSRTATAEPTLLSPDSRRIGLRKVAPIEPSQVDVLGRT